MIKVLTCFIILHLASGRPAYVDASEIHYVGPPNPAWPWAGSMVQSHDTILPFRESVDEVIAQMKQCEEK